MRRVATVSVINLTVATFFVVTYGVDMAQILEPRVRSLLQTVPVGVMATQRRDGRARQSTVYFVLDGDTIWISTEAARAKAIDVGRTGWASLCVVSPAAPYASVTVEGRAAIQQTDIAPMTGRILARITGGEAPELAESELAAAGRVLVRLDVDRVYGVSHLPQEESR
jgi:PPOX class probable F420-dependent enzyme